MKGAVTVGKGGMPRVRGPRKEAEVGQIEPFDDPQGLTAGETCGVVEKDGMKQEGEQERQGCRTEQEKKTGRKMDHQSRRFRISGSMRSKVRISSPR